jgi:hypothetical protein
VSLRELAADPRRKASGAVTMQKKYTLENVDKGELL